MSKNLLVIEPHQIMDASYELNLNELRTIQLCLANIYVKDGKLEADKFYKVELEQFAETFGLSDKATYEAVLGIIETLASRVLRLKTKLVKPDAKPTSNLATHWISGIIYDTVVKELNIRWSQEVTFIFNSLGKDNPYSRYYLDNTAKMRSVTSIRLYRLLNKWVKLGGNTWKLGEFKRLLGLNEENYPSYSDFKKKVIEKAVKDVIEYSNLDVKWEEEKVRGSRSVQSLRFKVGFKKEEKVVEVLSREEQAGLEGLGKFEWVRGEGGLKCAS